MHALYQNIAIFVFEGIAAVKAIRSIRKWYETDPFEFFCIHPLVSPCRLVCRAYTLFGEERKIQFLVLITLFSLHYRYSKQIKTLPNHLPIRLWLHRKISKQMPNIFGWRRWGLVPSYTKMEAKPGMNRYQYALTE